MTKIIFSIRPTAKQLEEEILSGLLTKHGLYEINKMKTTSKLVGNLNTEVNENIRSVVYNYDVTNMTIRQVLGLPHKIKLRQASVFNSFQYIYFPKAILNIKDKLK